MKNMSPDITPNNKRSIRDVSLPPRRSSSTNDVKPKSTRAEITPKTVKTTPSEYDFDYNVDRPRQEKRWGLIAIVGVFIIALIFGISSLFASATLAVTPKTQTVPLQATFTANKDQPAGQFGYQIVSVSASAHKDVAAGAEQQVDTKASGTVTLYNTSASTQNLIATTRVQTSSGLIFRLDKAVSVPKATVKNGQTTPGTIIASVTADKSGNQYNIEASDFTLPGLAGTSQAKNVYAKSTSSMTGGFSGIQKQVGIADLMSAQTALQNALTTELQNQISSQLPDNFILYPSSVNFSFGQVSQVATTTAGTATVTETATASAVIFDKALLSAQILNALSGSLSNQGDAQVSNLDSLTFVLTSPAKITKDYTGPISMTLSGDTNVVWLYDAVGLKSDILGLKKGNLNPLLSAKYPTIDSVSAKIFPIWKQSFPTDPDKIKIVTGQ